MIYGLVNVKYITVDICFCWYCGNFVKSFIVHGIRRMKERKKYNMFQKELYNFESV
jgi:hypothetical protein